MTNIFIEGIQGMGKSTLLQFIADNVPELKVCKEGDYSPVELAWCAWLDKEEYDRIIARFQELKEEIVSNTYWEKEHFIVTYTKIRTDITGFYEELEKYEIYNARREWAEFKEIILSRYQNFTESGYLFECSFLQNIVEDMILFSQKSDDEIVEFYKEIFETIQKDDFLLLYLYSDRIDDNIRVIKGERVDEEGNPAWYEMMMDYLVHSPYGVEHGYHGFEDLIAHLEHRQKVEMRIIKEVIKDNTIVLKAKEWTKEEIRNIVGCE